MMAATELDFGVIILLLQLQAAARMHHWRRGIALIGFCKYSSELHHGRTVARSIYVEGIALCEIA